MEPVELTRLRGDNPLGFLSALGALCVLADVEIKASLYWVGYTPFLQADLPIGSGSKDKNKKELVSFLHSALKKRPKLSCKLDPTTVFKKRFVDMKNEDFLRCCGEVIKMTDVSNRRAADLLAFYCVLGPENDVMRSNWILTTGQGHQDFLEIARNIIDKLNKDHLERALFGKPTDKDEGKKISFRLDPEEDRRFAFMDSNPSKKETKTLLGANALAFEGLRSFPAFMVRGDRLGVVAWDREGRRVRWPLWKYPVKMEVAKSLLSVPEIWSITDGDRRKEELAKEKLFNMGIFAVIESRIIFNDKFRNFTPGTPVWFC